jgi:branched-chain amino acid transport system substrate-binding protein
VQYPEIGNYNIVETGRRGIVQASFGGSSSMTRPPLGWRLAGVVAALLGVPPFAGAQEVKIGGFVTLSGISADVGAQMKSGMDVAMERMAADFKIDGKPVTVKIIYYDDEGKAEAGLNAVTRALTVDKITAGIGFLSSDVYIRVIDEFQKASTPVVACCSASLKIGDKIAEQKMQYVFQLSPTARDIATSVIAATATLVKPAKIAMLNENTDSGRDFSRISREWLAANAPAIEVVADEFVPRGVTDLTAQLAKFKRLGVGAIVGEVYGSSAPIYFQQYNELRVPGVIAHMGTSTSADSFVAEHGKLMEGSLINVRWIPGEYTAISKPFVEAYTKKTGYSPSTFAVQAHDSLLVVLEAIQAAGSLDPARIAKALEDTSYIAAWGPRKFTPLAEGHRMPVSTIVTQIQDGKKAVVYPPEAAAKQQTSFRAVPPYSWEK